MYFDFRTYFRFMYLAFFRANRVHFRLTVSRVVVLASFFALFPLFQLFNGICLLLDNLFFPGWRSQELDRPLFIVGPHRSGTTYLHRLLAKDEDQFFCLRLWEIVFPAILQKKAILLLGRIDRALGGHGEAMIRRYEARRLGDYHADIHELSLFEPEEDDKLQAHTFSTLALIWFVHAGELDWLLYFDEQASRKDKDRIMGFYRACLKRQAYMYGGKRRLLSKAPFACLRIRSLYEYFPGCRLVYTVRNPVDAVPSMMDVARKIWESAALLEDWQALSAMVYETVKVMYRYPLGCLDEADPATYALLVHDDLLQKPSGTVRAMLLRLGYRVGDALNDALLREDESQRQFRSRHRYSLEEFHLERERIVSDYKEVFDRFGFESEPEGERERVVPS
jgi:hypothetical protein